jgi:hypothetical protein
MMWVISKSTSLLHKMDPWLQAYENKKEETENAL